MGKSAAAVTATIQTTTNKQWMRSDALGGKDPRIRREGPIATARRPNARKNIASASTQEWDAPKSADAAAAPTNCDHLG